MLKQIHVDVWIDRELPNREYRVFIKHNTKVKQYQTNDIDSLVKDISEHLRNFEN